jgi:membrane protease YdiL (CAAX protease family)
MPVSHFQLVENPWLALLIIILAQVITLALFSGLVIGLFKRPRDAPMTQTIVVLLAHLSVLFVLAPFVLGLPGGTRSFSAYLDAIRLSRVQPFLQLLLLALSCYLILALCQVCGTLVYRLREGQPLNRAFVLKVLDVSSQLPPKSWDVLHSLPSIFEEIAFRGVVLSLFLIHYPQPTAVIIAALSFGAMHLLNLANGPAGTKPAWVLGQAAWAAILGLFYGVVVLRSGSLWPAMIVHYLGNLFVAPLTWYVQKHASAETQAVYGILFSFGLVPTTLMTLWVIAFTTLWPILA